MSTDARRCLIIVLAAGEGMRMRSSRPKVLHEIAGRSMLAHVLAAVGEAGAGDVAVVVGPDRDDVAAEALRAAPGAAVFVQRERRGTAHAVLAAREAIARGYDDILVTYADIPLLRGETLAAMRAGLAEGAGLVALGFAPADPTGYGRLIERDGRLVAIREHKDASAEEKGGAALQRRAGRLRGRRGARHARCGRPRTTRRANITLPISSKSRTRAGLTARTLEADEAEVMGVNDRVQLAAAEAAMQARLRRRAMLEGATLVAPETVVPVVRHENRPRRSHRAACGDRPGRRDRGRRGHPRLLASRRARGSRAALRSGPLRA